MILTMELSYSPSDSSKNAALVGTNLFQMRPSVLRLSNRVSWTRLVADSKRTLVLLSGGIDSLCCMHICQDLGHQVSALFVDYSQPSLEYERAAALNIAESYKASFEEVHFGSETLDFGAGELVGRNAFLIFSALLHSGANFQFLCIGTHAGTPYFDCSDPFISSCKKLVDEQTNGTTRLLTPLQHWFKPQVFEYAKQNRLPIDLTYSCESGYEFGCGVCASCKDREMLKCMQDADQ